MTPLDLSAVAEALRLTPATVRHHLRRAAAAGQPIGQQFAGRWLLTRHDLPTLRRWIAQARKAGKFSAGNDVHLLRKNPGRKPEAKQQ